MTIFRINNITLNNFRNHRLNSFDLEMNKNIILFTGENGSGKTSILEAISLLSPGKGMRKSTLKEMSRKSIDNIDNFEISINMINEFLEEKNINISTVNNKKNIKINNKNIQNYKDIKEDIDILWLSPEILLDISFHTSERRKFFDRIVFGFIDQHADNLILYEKLIASRMKFLISNNPKDESPWLNSLEKQIAEISLKIINNRNNIIKILNESSIQNDSKYTFSSIIEIDNKCVVCNEILKNKNTNDQISIILKKLQETRLQDSIVFKTTFGIHKNEILIKSKNLDNDIKYCSSGEQKDTILNLILTFTHELIKNNTNKSILLLIDEIFSFLDSSVRKKLIQKLLLIHQQIFLTSSNAVDLDFTEYKDLIHIIELKK